ncbi:PspA/IM30 family protein [Candidatus Poribacteria bacterium]|nr:PspA/IM30 family protein [Candidatus Poribacteria bacterium]MYB01924.1 PspA/IM30 family protein [Candidatus Poribacteria bacterium]
MVRGLKEISEQIREGLTQFIEAADGSESLIDKAILDMKKRLAAAKDLIATAIAEEQRLKRAYQDAIDTAETWGKRADDALQREDHVRASEAQQHKQQYQYLADDYKRQLDAQEAVVVRLKTALHEFYHQFQDAVKRAETLCQRQKQADTRAKLYKLLFDEIGNDVSKVFKQAEQKLKTTEAEAKMWEDKSCQTTTETETTGDNFNLDQALADLKEDVLGSDRK